MHAVTSCLIGAAGGTALSVIAITIGASLEKIVAALRGTLWEFEQETDD